MLFDVPFIFAGVIVLWVARLALSKRGVEALARALSTRRVQ